MLFKVFKAKIQKVVDNLRLMFYNIKVIIFLSAEVGRYKE